MQMPGYPPGVRSQFETHVHPWPTRYHGPIYTRPEFHFPYVQNPQAVFKPDDFSSFYAQGNITLDERDQGIITGLAIGAVAAGVVAYFVCKKRKR